LKLGFHFGLQLAYTFQALGGSLPGADWLIEIYALTVIA